MLYEVITIKVKSVKDVKTYDNRYGYVRLLQFQEGTARELQDAIAQLDKQTKNDLQGLVLVVVSALVDTVAVVGADLDRNNFV